MRLSVVSALRFMIGLCAHHVHAQAVRLPAPWDIALEGRFGLPRGYVKVGEHGIDGTRLKLHDDLGLDPSKAAELRVTYHLTARDTLRFSFLSLSLDGTTTLPDDILFNGSRLLGGTRLDTNADLYRITLAYERTLVSLPGGGMLSGSAGLTYVHLTVVPHGTEVLAAGAEKGPEDFWRQELPVPIFGLQADYALTPRLRRIASLAGGYVPWVDSLRSEGEKSSSPKPTWMAPWTSTTRSLPRSA
jgi:hypothetical protein